MTHKFLELSFPLLHFQHFAKTILDFWFFTKKILWPVLNSGLNTIYIELDYTLHPWYLEPLYLDSLISQKSIFPPCTFSFQSIYFLYLEPFCWNLCYFALKKCKAFTNSCLHMIYYLEINHISHFTLEILGQEVGFGPCGIWWEAVGFDQVVAIDD